MEEEIEEEKMVVELVLGVMQEEGVEKERVEEGGGGRASWRWCVERGN